MIKSKFPEAIVCTDVALDPYSSMGHDGVVEGGRILNDVTIQQLQVRIPPKDHWASRRTIDLPLHSPCPHAAASGNAGAGGLGRGGAVRHDGRPRGRDPRRP